MKDNTVTIHPTVRTSTLLKKIDNQILKSRLRSTISNSLREYCRTGKKRKKWKLTKLYLLQVWLQ